MNDLGASNSLSKEAKLSLISRSPVVATWSIVDTDNLSVGLELPFDSCFRGELVEDKSQKYLNFYGMYVPPELRGNGIGKRLGNALVYSAVACNTEVIRGSIESQYTLKIFQRIVDEGCISYFDSNPESRYAVSLPMTNQEAVLSLERAANFEPNLEFRIFGLGIVINLAGISLENLEKPL